MTKPWHNSPTVHVSWEVPRLEQDGLQFCLALAQTGHSDRSDTANSRRAEVASGWRFSTATASAAAVRNNRRLLPTWNKWEVRVTKPWHISLSPPVSVGKCEFGKRLAIQHGYVSAAACETTSFTANLEQMERAGDEAVAHLPITSGVSWEVEFGKRLAIQHGYGWAAACETIAFCCRA